MKKKKTIRNILIAVIAALVIAAAIFLTVALQKDGAGMNCFRRNAIAATGDGQQVRFKEYRVTYDMLASSYQSSALTDAQIRNLQEYAASEALMPKIYAKEAKALGLSLTDEQKASCKKTADDQINSIEQYYAESLNTNGNYSKAAVDKQVSAYFQMLGMSKDAYRAFLIESAESQYYSQAIENYYKENGSGVSEADLEAFYRKSVEESMTKENEDGTVTPTYTEGEFWNYLMLYQIGYSSPMLYVPEGFIYIDYILLETETVEEAQEIVRKVNDGETDFDELMNSDENKDLYRLILKAPYPIAENDHSSLFTEQEVYTKAAALQIGEIGAHIVVPETTGDEAAEDESTEEEAKSVSIHLFRRAEGNMCYDGDHGVIKMDYFDGIRDSAESQYRLDQWLSDVRFEDVIYTYKGVLE